MKADKYIEAAADLIAVLKDIGFPPPEAAHVLWLALGMIAGMQSTVNVDGFLEVFRSADFEHDFRAAFAEGHARKQAAAKGLS